MVGRMAALLMALLLLTGAQAQGAYVVQAAGIAALVDGDGETLLAGDAIEALYTLKEGSRFAAGRAEALGLYDARGRRLGDGQYETLEAAGDVVLFRQNSLFGAMDTNGATLVEPAWAQLVYAGEGAFLALSGDLYDDQPDEMISVTVDGGPLNTGSFTANGLRAFHDGRMAFMLSDGQYGHVDALGRQVIPPQWRYASDFSEGVAIVSDGDGLGLIDVEGRVVLPPRFRWIQRGEGLIAALRADGCPEIYSSDGANRLFAIDAPVDEAEVCGGYVVLKRGDVAHVYDKSGACVYEAPRAALFFPGLAGQIIVADGQWGAPCQRLLNPGGSVASEGCQRLLPLCGGRYAFMTFPDGRFDDAGARFGLLASDGRALLDAAFLEILPAGDDRLVLTTGESVQFADLDGNVLREWPVTGTAASSS